MKKELNEKDHVGQETLLHTKNGIWQYDINPPRSIVQTTALSHSVTRSEKEPSFFSRIVWSRRLRWAFTLFAIVINIINLIVVIA